MFVSLSFHFGCFFLFEILDRIVVLYADLYDCWQNRWKEIINCFVRYTRILCRNTRNCFREYPEVNEYENGNCSVSLITAIKSCLFQPVLTNLSARYSLCTIRQKKLTKSIDGVWIAVQYPKKNTLTLTNRSCFLINLHRRYTEILMAVQSRCIRHETNQWNKSEKSHCDDFSLPIGFQFDY